MQYAAHTRADAEMTTGKRRPEPAGQGRPALPVAGIDASAGLPADVDGQAKAAEALRESEAQYHEVVERANDGIAILQGGLAVFVNEALARMSGYSVSELTGMHFLTLVQERQQAQIAERVRRRLAGEEVPSAYEIGLMRKDGTPFTVEVSASLISHANAPADLVLLRDITEYKRVKEALQQSEEKYRLLVENSNDVIYMFDLDGVLTFASPAWTVLLGHPVDQVVGQPFQQFVHPDDTAKCLVLMQRAIETGLREVRVEYRVRRADGCWRWHSTNVVSLWDEADTVIGFEGIARDITERKQAEEGLRESQERLREAYRLAHIGVWNWTASTDTVIWTDELYRIAGLDPKLPAPPTQNTPTSMLRKAGVVCRPRSRRQWRPANLTSSSWSSSGRTAPPDG